MINFLQQVINGISLGSIYALIALGYTMVYGVLRLINFAHGDVYMFGAFMGYYLTPYLTSKLAKLPILSAVFAPGSMMFALLVMFGSMFICALLGMVIERFAYRPGRSGSRFTMAFWLGLLGAVIGYYTHPSYGGLIGGALIGVIVGMALEMTVFKKVQKASRLAFLIIAIGV